jgi:hypothetical protein
MLNAALRACRGKDTSHNVSGAAPVLSVRLPHEVHESETVQVPESCSRGATSVAAFAWATRANLITIDWQVRY